MMTTLKRDIFINASAEDIYALTSDARRFPEWYAGIERAEPDDVFPQPGGKVRVDYKAAGISFKLTMTSLEQEPAKRIINQMEGMITGTNRWSYEPEGEGTRVRVEFEYEMPGGALGKLANRLLVERMNAENLAKSLENLKAVAEG
jgi:uncharacterized membrane protein